MEKEEFKGGNCNVIIEGNTAKKTIRNTSSHEKIERFKRELSVFEELKKLDIPNLVRVLRVETNDNTKKSYILMKKYSGCLDDIVSEFKGDVLKSISALLKVIKCLSFIYKKYGIVHRDIKPNNILYEKNGNEIELFITDFGICYLKDEDLRLTPQEMSVGPRNYMAPEYEIGKVENVTEKGDIYSLGKVLWHMINGKPDEIFPSFVYFIDEYSLSKRFNNTPHIEFANYIISLCVNLDPLKRISYDSLINEIENYIKNKTISTNQLLIYKAKEYSSIRDLTYKQVQAKNVTLVNLFLSSFMFYVKKYADECKLHILELIVIEFSRREKSGHYETRNVINNTNHYLFSSQQYDNVHFQGDYIPGNDTATTSIIYSVRKSKNVATVNKIECYYRENSIVTKYKNAEAPFDRDIFNTFLTDFLNDLVK